ncbi:MAG: hypothetical protein CV087_23750, partial [Candidatus Brocadia sp. WS118]
STKRVSNDVRRNYIQATTAQTNQLSLNLLLKRTINGKTLSALSICVLAAGDFTRLAFTRDTFLILNQMFFTEIRTSIILFEMHSSIMHINVVEDNFTISIFVTSFD